MPDFAMVIDNRTKYAQSAIDEFSDAKKMPQIAISVDMLDTVYISDKLTILHGQSDHLEYSAVAEPPNLLE